MPDRETGPNPLAPTDSVGAKTIFRSIALGVSAVASAGLRSSLSFGESLAVSPLGSRSSSRGGGLDCADGLPSSSSNPGKNCRVKSPGGLGCTAAVASPPMPRNSAEMVPAFACAARGEEAAADGGSSSDLSVSNALVISSRRPEPRTTVGRSFAGRTSATSVTLSSGGGRLTGGTTVPAAACCRASYDWIQAWSADLSGSLVTRYP